MTTDRPLPLFATLTWESTRAEVLAALDQIDAQRRSLFDLSDPPEGVIWCNLGSANEDDDLDVWDRTAFGDVLNLRAFNRHMERVGEEDQSGPEWDAGL